MAFSDELVSQESLGMTEWTLVTIPTTSIGEMKLAPNMFLALVGLGIRRLAPSGLLGFAFPLGMGFGFALRKYRSCIIRFPISFVGFPEGGVGLAGAARRSFPSSIWRRPIWVCVRLDCFRRLMMVRSMMFMRFL